MSGLVAGIDIGGTKIATLVVDADGAVRGRATHASTIADQHGAPAAIAACLSDALGAAGMTRNDLHAIGVGVPGRVDTERGRVTLDGRRQPAQLDLVEAVAATGTPVVAVALRGPWDVAAYPPAVTALATYSILPDSLQALAAVLAGQADAPGRLPVAVES